ncbi:MAG: carboxymuconolactone decarboxylase family protein [Myxococcales bacterium]|nr:carboxymuconolactone decarboxylase family protein [Myxococcales bacterium]
MSWIREIAPAAAEGRLARLFAAATRRAGKIFNVLRVQSVEPAVMQASIQLYQELMFAPGPLRRDQREMIAVAVSRANGCVY